jgi:hypothetical protein
MTEQEARTCIMRWAKWYFTQDDPFEAPPDVEVLECSYDTQWEEWEAKLEVSSSADKVWVQFWEDKQRPYGIYVTGVEY